MLRLNLIVAARLTDFTANLPDTRLHAVVGGITFPVGFFILGWTSNPGIFWFPSLIGLAFIGASFLLIFQVNANRSFFPPMLYLIVRTIKAGINYLLDAYTM